MKTWLQINWFKVAILLIFLLGIILVFGYTLKQQDFQKKKQLSTLNATCEKLAAQKKEQIIQEDKELYLGNVYEYRYNPTYDACILAYNGSYLGTSLSGKLLGHNLVEINNLTTGQIIMSERFNPGETYKQINDKFKELRDQYIGPSAPNKI